MAKFTGVLGVVSDYVDQGHGVYTPKIIEYAVNGDLLQASISSGSGGKINTDLSFSNRFSFIAHPNLLSILSEASTNEWPLYLTWCGIKLKVTNVVLAPPRVTLSVGGVYNE